MLSRQGIKNKNCYLFKQEEAEEQGKNNNQNEARARGRRAGGAMPLRGRIKIKKRTATFSRRIASHKRQCYLFKEEGPLLLVLFCFLLLFSSER
jgi:hypothetical protein